MLLDTGADVSLVPRSATAGLALPDEPAERVRLLGFDGTSSTAEAFEGRGDYTRERDELLGDLSLDHVLEEIQQQREPSASEA
jgi:hypothetical protein